MRNYIVEYENSGNEHSPDWRSVYIEAESIGEAAKKFEEMNILYYDIYIHENKSE